MQYWMSGSGPLDDLINAYRHTGKKPDRYTFGVGQDWPERTLAEPRCGQLLPLASGFRLSIG
jgi:hypothetical protein